VIYILLVQLKYNYQQLHDTVSVVACLNFLFSSLLIISARCIHGTSRRTIPIGLMFICVGRACIVIIWCTVFSARI